MTVNNLYSFPHLDKCFFLFLFINALTFHEWSSTVQDPCNPSNNYISLYLPSTRSAFFFAGTNSERSNALIIFRSSRKQAEELSYPLIRYRICPSRGGKR